MPPDPATVEDTYHFIRNDQISAGDIAQSGFAHIANIVRERLPVRALHNTTGMAINILYAMN